MPHFSSLLGSATTFHCISNAKYSYEQTYEKKSSYFNEPHSVFFSFHIRQKDSSGSSPFFLYFVHQFFSLLSCSFLYYKLTSVSTITVFIHSSYENERPNVHNVRPQRPASVTFFLFSKSDQNRSAIASIRYRLSAVDVPSAYQTDRPVFVLIS